MQLTLRSLLTENKIKEFAKKDTEKRAEGKKLFLMKKLIKMGFFSLLASLSIC